MHRDLGASALMEVWGCVAKWQHRALLLKLRVTTEILLTLVGEGRMREVREQGVSGFQLSLAPRDSRVPIVHLRAIAYHK